MIMQSNGSATGGGADHQAGLDDLDRLDLIMRNPVTIATDEAGISTVPVLARTRCRSTRTGSRG